MKSTLQCRKPYCLQHPSNPCTPLSRKYPKPHTFYCAGKEEMKTEIKAPLHTHTRESNTSTHEKARERRRKHNDKKRKEEDRHWTRTRKEKRPGMKRLRKRAKRGLGRRRGNSGTYDRGGPIAVHYHAPMTVQNTLNPIFRV